MADEGESESSTESSASEATEKTVINSDVGRRVAFFSNQDKKEKFGTLRYYGRPEFATGVWCGVELDRPEGKNNGSKHGIRYFTCEPAYGVFVPVERVQIDSTRRCRSRPNSRPNSRPSSAERVRKIEGNNGSTRLRPVAVQQELARLVQQVPVTDHLSRRKTASNSVTNSRQPLKAFAHSKDDGIIVNHNVKQSALPFKGRCIQRAASSENLRKLNENGSKYVKKSSSERNLQAGNTLPRSTKSPSKRCSRPQSVSSEDKEHNCPRTSTPKTHDATDGSSGSSPEPEHTANGECNNMAIIDSGLSTHAKQLVESQRNSSAGMCRVASPDSGKSRNISHPLSQVTDPTPQTIKDLLTVLIKQNKEIIERQAQLEHKLEVNKKEWHSELKREVTALQQSIQKLTVTPQKSQ